MPNSTLVMPQPKTAAILITYQCVAQCDECCFACNPHILGSALSLNEIKLFLDNVSKIDSIKVVVFSGGECFLEFDILEKSIEYATSLGLMTRCVSSGFWGKNITLAEEKINRLKKAGLSEINFSTGDSHQQFVSIERVLYATIASLRAGLTTCIAVETNKNKIFTVEDIKNHSLYIEYIKNTDLETKLIIMPTVWVSFHTDTIYDFSEDPLENNGGCTGVFDTVGLESKTGIVGCCGLTVNNIPEMHLGRVKNDSLEVMLRKHYNDFLKIWIFVDGPKKIIEIASEWLNRTPPQFAHKCLYCAYLYNDKEIKDSIVEHIELLKEDVLEKYYQKCLMFNYT